MRVAVLCGGQSEEREISLKSGEHVWQALLKKGYAAVKIDVDRDLVQRLAKEAPDIAFLALHGRLGEDGTIQGLLEVLGIPYTGSGVLASALALDKITTKRLLTAVNLPTPAFFVLNKEEISGNFSQCFQKVASLGFPCVVKPSCQGSSIGVSFPRNAKEFQGAVLKALRYSSEVLVEKFLSGTEVTASLLGNNHPQVLPLIEIVARGGLYDYEAKYTPGFSEHLIPPRLPLSVQEKIKKIASQAYLLLKCRGFARVDFLVSENSEPFVLEVNTIPGLTPLSLFPDAARAAGLAFPELVEKIIQLAFEKD